MGSFGSVRKIASAVAPSFVKPSIGTGAEPVDQIDMTATFTNNELAELKRCEDNTDSLILHGAKVTVQQGLCGATLGKNNKTIPFFRPLSPTLATCSPAVFV